MTEPVPPTPEDRFDAAVATVGKLARDLTKSSRWSRIRDAVLAVVTAADIALTLLYIHGQYELRSLEHKQEITACLRSLNTALYNADQDATHDLIATFFTGTVKTQADARRAFNTYQGVLDTDKALRTQNAQLTSCPKTQPPLRK